MATEINRDEFLGLSFSHHMEILHKTKNIDNVSKAIRTLVTCIEGEVDRDTLQSLIGIKHRTYFRSTYIKPALDEGYIEFTLPNEKQSKLQKYRLTAKGIALKNSLTSNK